MISTSQHLTVREIVKTFKAAKQLLRLTDLRDNKAPPQTHALPA